MRIAIKDLRELAKKRGLSHIIVFATDDADKQHVATFGRTKRFCLQAADFGNRLKEALGWPESLRARDELQKKLERVESERESAYDRGYEAGYAEGEGAG